MNNRSEKQQKRSSKERKALSWLVILVRDPRLLCPERGWIQKSPIPNRIRRERRLSG